MRLISFQFANAAAREAAQLTLDDIGRAAIQLDDHSFWLLKDAPGTWQKIADEVVQFTPEARPAPDATWARKFISIWAEGLVEEVQYCRRAADGSYEWVIVAF